uniref:NADH-ubiquinone oxidoreductase chain 3 n=1 Tax=Pseudodendrothrips mori TaxID=1291231 RepID=A0A7M3T2A0_9NEOP|nr:NADH dehydrogenase subunit 3 [Pseudodendrothrips mori]QFO91094.1 NADH dehydrogenase subunit 3 [Pseudodendrothrips mori]
MTKIILTIFFLIFISMALFSICLIFSKKTNNWREKFIPFECGFNFFSYSRLPFSLQFFLIAIIFIIFDVEIALILPLIFSFKLSSIFKWNMTISIFLIILILGVLIEWKETSFEWKL